MTWWAGGQLVFLAGVGSSFASVEVENGEDCLTPEAVDLELRVVLDDEVVDRFVTHVTVRRAPDGVLELSVLDDRHLLWSRELPFSEADCPYLPEVIARSVERGIASLPAWRLSSARGSWSSELGFQVFGLAPPGAPLQIGLGGALWLGFGRFGGVQVVVEGRSGEAVPVAVGQLQFIGTSVTAGPAFQVPVANHALRGALRLGTGPTWFRGSGFDRENMSGWWWRWTTAADLGWAFPGALSVYGRAEMGVEPVPFVAAVHGEAVSYVEPWLRTGVVVEFSGTLRKQ